MNLPSNLISDFVKITNDTKKTKTETIVYGTAVESDGVMYVRIDGSDLLTPAVATADTKNNERVTVMIKNHTAVITGNISSPAARKGDVQEVVEASADYRPIKESVDDLTADMVDVKNDIDNLQKTNLSLVETLNSHGASIETINQTLLGHGNDITSIISRLDEIDNEIVSIKSRLDALENPSE